MSQWTAIEWTDATWNPVTGCSVVSPGCTNCYAMKMARRCHAMAPDPSKSHYFGTTKVVNGNAVWTGKMAQAPKSILLAPLRRRKPTIYFVNSMGDLFHEAVPDEWIDRVFAVMALCPQHTFQVLTKRSKRMREYFERRSDNRSPSGFQCPRINHILNVADRMSRTDFPAAFSALAASVNAGKTVSDFPNVWLGVSTEDQQRADERIPDLLATPAAVRFISAEPLLGPIDLQRLSPNGIQTIDPLAGISLTPSYAGWSRLDWVIVGGESGHGARPMHPDWARSLRDQCAAAGVPFFFKQWGEWAPNIGAVDGWKIGDNPEISRFDHREWEDGSWSDVFRPMWCDFQDGNYDEQQCVSRIGKAKAGRLLDGVEHNGMPSPE